MEINEIQKQIDADAVLLLSVKLLFRNILCNSGDKYEDLQMQYLKFARENLPDNISMSFNEAMIENLYQFHPDLLKKEKKRDAQNKEASACFEAKANNCQKQDNKKTVCKVCIKTIQQN